MLNIWSTLKNELSWFFFDHASKMHGPSGGGDKENDMFHATDQPRAANDM
jgi:hypothetical protein